MRPDEREEWSLGDAESALVGRMLAGDEMAFEEFADQYLPPLHRFATRRVGDRELAREIVQSTVVKAISKLATFRGDAGLTTWLCACCRNEIADHFRRRGREGVEVALSAAPHDGGVEPESGEASPESRLLSAERRALVHDALDRLPPHYARALEWKYLERLPVDEIAARLELSPKAAESVLSRARVAFRSAFDAPAPGATQSAAKVSAGRWSTARSR